MPEKYMLIERNAYMEYCNVRYFDDYNYARKEFEELKRLNQPCTLLSCYFIDSYTKEY